MLREWQVCTGNYFNGTLGKIFLRRGYLNTDLKEEKKRTRQVYQGRVFLAESRNRSAFTVKYWGWCGWREMNTGVSGGGWRQRHGTEESLGQSCWSLWTQAAQEDENIWLLELIGLGSCWNGELGAENNGQSSPMASVVKFILSQSDAPTQRKPIQTNTGNMIWEMPHLGIIQIQLDFKVSAFQEKKFPYCSPCFPHGSKPDWRCTQRKSGSQIFVH